jgi:hypothetical protein
MIVHDWLIEFSQNGHRGLCRACGRSNFTAAHNDFLDVGGECVPVETQHDWALGIAGRAYACCTLCGLIRSAIPFDGQTRYGPLDLSGDCAVIRALAAAS